MNFIHAYDAFWLKQPYCPLQLLSDLPSIPLPTSYLLFPPLIIQCSVSDIYILTGVESFNVSQEVYERPSPWRKWTYPPQSTPSSSQIGVWSPGPLLAHARILTGLVLFRSYTIAECSWVHRPCNVQKTLCHPSHPWPLDLTIFVPPLLQCRLSLGRRWCVIVVP